MVCKIKLCGMMRKDDISFVNEALPEYAGFVFADTRRRITGKDAARFRDILDDRIKAVGVFVNADIDYVVRLLEDDIIDIAQLHGDEDNDYILRLKELTGKPVIKAIRVRDVNCIDNPDTHPADYFLMDAYVKGLPGGTGESFDWNIVDTYKKTSNKPLFLAGGININNCQKAMNYEPFALDISSGIETDGYKDKDKIIEICRRIRNV